MKMRLILRLRNILLLLPVALCSFATNLHSASITSTWTLGSSGVWNVAGNWDNGVPNNGGGNTFTAIVNDRVSNASLHISPTINNLTLASRNASTLGNRL